MSAPGEERPELLTRPQLKDRGWSDGEIGKFLDAPDVTKPNPYYRDGPPMRLWSVARVAATEASEDYRAFHFKTQNRRRARIGLANVQRARTIELVTTVKVRVTVLPDAAVIEAALRSHNARGRKATPDSPPEFLQRIAVNYVRRNLTRYDATLDRLFGRAGRAAAYEVLRPRVLTAIAQAYPTFGGECRRQEQRCRAEVFEP